MIVRMPNHHTKMRAVSHQMPSIDLMRRIRNISTTSDLATTNQIPEPSPFETLRRDRVLLIWAYECQSHPANDRICSICDYKARRSLARIASL